MSDEELERRHQARLKREQREVRAAEKRHQRSATKASKAKAAAKRAELNSRKARSDRYYELCQERAYRRKKKREAWEAEEDARRNRSGLVPLHRKGQHDTD